MCARQQAAIKEINKHELTSRIRSNTSRNCFLLKSDSKFDFRWQLWIVCKHCASGRSRTIFKIQIIQVLLSSRESTAPHNAPCIYTKCEAHEIRSETNAPKSEHISWIVTRTKCFIILIVCLHRNDFVDFENVDVVWGFTQFMAHHITKRGKVWYI